MKFTKSVVLALKGCAMGMADVVPGVSGGTIAFISGIYEELIDSIRSVDATALRLLARLRLGELWRHVNGRFLLPVLTGIAIAVFSLARLMTYLLTHHPIAIWSFFFGLIVASALLDDLSHDARLVGAVNCVRRTADSRLVGHNTDVIGLRAAFDCLLGGEQPSHALVLGTGGASQAVQYVLAERGIPFDLVSRDAAKGNYTYDNLPCEAVEQSRLIVNASPVGTYPAVDAAPRIPYGYLTPGHYLLDLVYNPPLTRFLDLGRQRGARILNGEVMFRRQAEASWRIWNE